jgi:hypothetical protein
MKPHGELNTATEVEKCHGRECEQAFLCWRYLKPEATEQKWGDYDELRQPDKECEAFSPVRELVRRRDLGPWGGRRRGRLCR